MIAKNATLTIVALVCAISLASPAVAQPGNNPTWHGQDNEFGKIRTPYHAEMNGEAVPVEASVVLLDNYEDKEARFFIFGFSVENQPGLKISFDHLVRADTGEELPCYQREGTDTTAIKCSVDLKFMPPAGTEIKMSGTVDARKAGSFQVGAIVVPLTYTWGRIQQSNGLNAELYSYTILSVNSPSLSGGGPAFIGDGNKVPGIGVLGVAAAGLAAAGLAAAGRRRRG